MCVQRKCFLLKTVQRKSGVAGIEGFGFNSAQKSWPARSFIVFLCGINSMQKCQCNPAALMPDYCQNEKSDASQRVTFV